jgi:hypothetical protein
LCSPPISLFEAGSRARGSGFPSRLNQVGVQQHLGKRRTFIAGLGGAVATWPGVAQAESVPLVGYLSTVSAGRDEPTAAAFRQGVREAGFIDSRNVSSNIAMRKAKLVDL